MSKRKPEKVIILLTIAFALILASAGTVSAVSYTVELPSSITPGSPVQGTVYFTDGAGEKVTSFSTYLSSIPSLTFQGNIEVPEAISDIAEPVVSSKKVTWTSVSGYSLSSDKVPVCTFTFTAPELPGTYRVTIANYDENYPTITTNLGTYENTPGNLPLIVTPAEFTIPGIIPDIQLQVELPAEIAAGQTAEGFVYIFGGKDQTIEGYSISLTSDPSGDPLSIQITDTPLGTPTGQGTAGISYVDTSGSGSIKLASDKELVCKFTVTAPAAPSKSAYTVGFNALGTSIVTTNYNYAIINDGDARHPYKILTAVPAVFAVTGGSPAALGLDITIPEKLDAGSIGTGEVYLVGGSGEKLSGFQIYLKETGDESLGISVVNEEDKILGYGTTQVVGSKLLFFDTNGITLDSSRVKVCEFTFTIPESPQQHSYAIDFLFKPEVSKDTRVDTENADFGKTNVGTAEKSFVYLQSSGDVLYIDAELELFSYNGWTQTVKRTEGNYDPVTNVTDSNTGTEVWTVKDIILGHFNAVNKSQIVYKYGGSLTTDCRFIDTPQFYAYSGKNISMNKDGGGSAASIHHDGKVTVKYYSSTQNPVTDSALGIAAVTWDDTNKCVNLSEAAASVPANAAYCLMFFEGYPLGDVTGDNIVEAADISYMSSCFAGGVGTTDTIKFYGDVTSDGFYEGADLTRLSSYRAAGVSEDYV